MRNGTDIAAFVRSESNAVRYSLAREAGGRMQHVSRAEPGDPDEIARRFWQRAEAFADESQSDQRFLVVAYDADGAVREQYPFRIGGADLDLTTLAAPDTADSSGVVRATLRHLDAREQGVRKLQGELIGSLRHELHSKAKRIEELERQNDKLREKHAEFLDVLETAKTQTHARRLAQIDAESDAKVKGWLFEQLQLFAPILTARLTGSTEIAKFVQTLDVAKLDAILATLTEDQRAAFEGFLLRAAKAQSSEKRLAHGS